MPQNYKIYVWMSFPEIGLAMTREIANKGQLKISGKFLRPLYWKTHPIINWRILGRQTGRFTGKLIHSNFLTENIYDMQHLIWMSFPVKRPV